MFIFDETKFIKKDELFIFLIANEASDGILGFSLIILRAISLIASIVAVNLFDNFLGKLSTIASTVA